MTRDGQEDWSDRQIPRNSGRHSRPAREYDGSGLPAPERYAPPDPYAAAGQYAQPDPYGYDAPGAYAAPDPYAADPAAQTDPSQLPGSYSQPGYPAEETFGLEHDSYDEPAGHQDRNGYRHPGARDQPAGYPGRSGYGGPGAYDRPAGYGEQNGYGQPEYPGLPPGGGGPAYGGPPARPAAPGGPDAYPAAPGPGDHPPFRWQPSPDAVGPHGPGAGPGFPGGAEHEPLPGSRDWDQAPAHDWDVSEEPGGFAEFRPDQQDAGTGPRPVRSGPADTGTGPRPARLQPPGPGPGGRRPRPSQADPPGQRDAAPPPREGLIPGFWDGPDSRPGRARRPRRRVSRVLAPLLAVALLCVLAAGGYDIYRKLQSQDFTGSGFGHVTVQVLPGASATSLAPELVKLGVVASTSSFISAAKHSANPDGLEPGFFSLHKHMNSALAFRMLLSPAARIQTTVTIPEGLRMSQILTTLEQKSARTIPASAFVTASKDTSALGLPAYAGGDPEGYLFPATYDFNPGTSALAMLQAMVARFNQEATTIDLPVAARAARLTPSQVITVASLVQAEAGNPKYFRDVAEVIYNRLNDGMKLGLQSTVNFALNRSDIHLTASQLRVNSPYNTYTHTGLPPGPIDSPGDAAIEAALHPAHGNLLYFVTVNLKTGLTKFTSSNAQFQQFVAECDKNDAC